MSLGIVTKNPVSSTVGRPTASSARLRAAGFAGVVELKRGQQLVPGQPRAGLSGSDDSGMISPAEPVASRLRSWATRRRVLIGWSVLAAAFIVFTVVVGGS